MARNKSLQTVEEVEAAVEILEARDQSIAPYLAGSSADPERLRSEVEIFHHQHVNSAFEVGRRLVVLREILPKGQFVPYVLDHVGISKGHAYALMTFARTCIELSAATNGLLDFNKLKTMDQKKVLLLGELVEENPEELEATGTINGEKLDELAAKSRKELQHLARQTQERLDKAKAETAELKEKLLIEKEKRDTILAATPNAISQSITRVGNQLRDALTDFRNTAVLAPGKEMPDATAVDIAVFRSHLRQFYHRFMETIEQRFPDVEEVPTDTDLIPDVPQPAKGKRKTNNNVVDL